MKMRFAKRLANSAATAITLALLCAALATSPSASFPKAYQATPQGVPGVQDLDEQRGPFAIGDQNYTVVLHFKRLSAPSDPLFAQTLASLEIRDAAGSAVYERNFPFALAAGGFRQNLSATVERLSGNTGAGLVIHYTEQTGASQAVQPQAGEFWQLFGLVNGKLA